MIKYTRGKYPDGWIYADIQDIEDGETITEQINNYEDLWFIKLLKETIDNLGVKDINLKILCMPDQQADARFKDTQSFNLKAMCEFINNLNFNRVIVYHPHSLVTSALINNCTVISPKEFINSVLLNLYRQGVIAKNLVVVSPDAGSFKWIQPIIAEHPEIELVCANKSRVNDTMVNVINKDDFNGKVVLIIDDICVKGSTFINLAQEINKRNAGAQFLAVSHITIRGLRPELGDLFNRIYTTNSKSNLGKDYSVGNVTTIYNI